MARTRLPSHIALAVALLAAACREPTTQRAADFTLPVARGGEFRLDAQPAQPILIAFLRTVPDTADTPSRRQAVFLLSMQHQYASKGLRIAIVDAAAVDGAPEPPLEALINASYDWHLTMPLLRDPGGRVAAQFGVDTAPTLFLLRSDRRTFQRWNGLTLPAVLAQGIEQLLAAGARSTPGTR